MRAISEKSKQDTLITSDGAVSTVVGAVLALALLILVIGVIRVSYVPVWIGDAEYAHMDDTWSDMADLKASLDMISALMTADPDSRFSVSTSIDMGGGIIPLINSQKSSGTLSVNTNIYNMTISAINGSGTVYYSGTDLTDLGTIRYSSNNHHYLQQTFAYENGAMILVQDNRSLMRLSPGISITSPAPGTTRVTVNAIHLQGASRSISSSSVEEVYTSGESAGSLFSGGVIITDLIIGVRSDYPSAWEDYFNRSARAAGLAYGTNYTMVSGPDSVTFILTGGSLGEDIQLSVRKTIVSARLGMVG